MLINFEISQSITLEELFIRDLTILEGEVISKYRIEYKPYFDTDDSNKYYFETSIQHELSSLQAGVYISLSEFTNGVDSPVVVNDDSYYVTLHVYYDNDVEVESTSKIINMYQDVLNKYSQKNLIHNWNDRYKEKQDTLLKIAEEMTWIDSLEAASSNLSRPETFKEILIKLHKYFTLTYDY